MRINFFRKSALLRLSNNEDTGSLQPSSESIPIEQEEGAPPLGVFDAGQIWLHEVERISNLIKPSATVGAAPAVGDSEPLLISQLGIPELAQTLAAQAVLRKRSRHPTPSAD